MMLEIKDLTCGYDSGFMLKDINLQIEQGEFTGIIGPNGSGKTTLLKSITGLLKPKSGEILLQGKNIRSRGYKELAKELAVITQGVEGNYMTVKEFILLGRTPYYKRFQIFETKNDIKIAEKYMDLTDISKYKDHPMNEISGGERQLALIARALTQQPKLLLLDEPIAHLDITHQVKILDLIKKLNKESGLTVLLVLHDLNHAGEYCDKLVLINNGKLHKIGTPEDVLTYQIIEEVYKTVVIVEKNPLSKKPYVLAVSGEKLGSVKKY